MLRCIGHTNEITYNDIRGIIDISQLIGLVKCAMMWKKSLLSGHTQENRLSANTYNDARADIKARGFWVQRQCAYIFDVRVSYIF